MSAIVISFVEHAQATETHDIDAQAVIELIRTDPNLARATAQVRRLFGDTLARTNGDRTAAKRAVDALKKVLPAVMWSGRFSSREKPVNEKLIAHSGLLCADLDGLGDQLEDVRTRLLKSPNLWALFRSPTGDGLKAIFRVVADATKHHGSFLAVQKHVMDLTGKQIDESCKDVTRLCFLSSHGRNLS